MNEIGILLVLIYSGLSIGVERQPSMDACYVEAPKRIGERLLVKIWDDMGGSNPVPHVVIAYCVAGAAADEILK